MLGVAHCSIQCLLLNHYPIPLLTNYYSGGWGEGVALFAALEGGQFSGDNKMDSVKPNCNVLLLYKKGGQWRRDAAVVVWGVAEKTPVISNDGDASH